MSLLPAVVSFALLASAISALPYYDPFYAPRGAPVADDRPHLPYKYFYDTSAADYYTPAIYNTEDSQHYASDAYNREEAKYYLTDVNEPEESYSALDDAQDPMFKSGKGKNRKYTTRPLWTKERCKKCGKRCRKYKQCAKYLNEQILDIATQILEELLKKRTQPTVEVPATVPPNVPKEAQTEKTSGEGEDEENDVEKSAKTFVGQQREDSSTLKKGRGIRNPIKRGRQIKKILCIFLNCSFDEYE
ncbi:hypothetical protein QR680_010470 [Steinernema hermaphroditum]|uniref:Uncharacterized protein n=1 Tax=Steinernema hermaphroditum TaxID=289476 RepID=A0AA39IP50_9BILA|nr:hypothetical protein QR680_010470 [Steinernema hermaphroditum]